MRSTALKNKIQPSQLKLIYTSQSYHQDYVKKISPKGKIRNRYLPPSKAISEYIEYLEALNYSVRSVYNWRCALLKLHKFFKKHGKSILNAQRNDIYRFVNQYSKQHDRYTKEPGKLQFSTIREYLCDFLRFYKFCDRFSIAYSGDKLTLERMQHMRIEPKPVTTPLSLREMDRLLNEPTKQIYRLIRLLTIIHILYASGIRISELLSLRVDNMSLDENIMTIIGKGNKERLAFITDECAEYIKFYLNTARPFLLKNSTSPYLILTHQGERFATKSSLADEIKEIATQAGINRHVHPHLFRHTFAHHLYEAGVDIRYLQEMLGHEWVSTTQRYLPTISWNKLCHEYSKAFDHKNKETLIVKEPIKKHAITKDHKPLKFQNKPL